MILTVDLGTTATKAALWDSAGPLEVSRVSISTDHPAPNWAEQDATTWWTSTVGACRSMDLAAVTAIGLTGARETFAPIDATGAPTGPAIVWSDRRAETGAAKLDWISEHRPEWLIGCRWILSPRDLLLFRLSGRPCTDETMASVGGLYDDRLELLPQAAPYAALLPPVVPPASVIGHLHASAADDLGMAPGVPIVIGAGDRQCEVVGTAATTSMPMVSWGTTANVSVPVLDRPVVAPPGLRCTRHAVGGWLLEGGLSSAGALLAWLGRLTGCDPETLVAEAGRRAAGARGVIALPWLGGARAPWWRADVGAVFSGLGPGHDRADLARAAIEGVAFDVARCLPGQVDRLVLAGGGAVSEAWAMILGSVTGLPVILRRSPEAASAGAALLTAGAGTSVELTVDNANAVVKEVWPDVTAVAAYAEIRQRSDVAAQAVMMCGSPPENPA